uniref:Exosome complex component RRP40 n=1 Tax=Ciona intestinalis TaxID=7719 RepID=F6QMW7_CIOIN
VMSQSINNKQIVIPGDVITKHVNSITGDSDVKLGPGLYHEADEVKVCKPGVLRHKTPDTFWVDCHQKRYVPSKGDNVVGVVTSRQGDMYKVDIGASHLAVLNYMSFEGASKRNRPNVTNGDLIFGKLIVANKDMEPEVSCVDPNNGKANGLGVLSDRGFSFHVPLNLARKLLSPSFTLIHELGARITFEITVGMNGRIFLSCNSPKFVILIMDVILSAEYLSNEQMEKLLNEINLSLSQ